MTGIMPFAAAFVSAIVSSVVKSAAGEWQSDSCAHLL
jgi:sorbitol-specific phosphotransferase system component IIBC